MKELDDEVIGRIPLDSGRSADVHFFGSDMRVSFFTNWGKPTLCLGLDSKRGDEEVEAFVSGFEEIAREMRRQFPRK